MRQILRIAILTIQLAWTLSLPAADEAKTYRYRFLTGQEFHTVSRVLLTAEPSQDAPTGFKGLRDIILHYRIEDISDDGNAIAAVKLKHLSMRTLLRGEWVNTPAGSMTGSEDLEMRIQISPLGRVEFIPISDRTAPPPPSAGALDLPLLPSEAIVAGGTWTANAETGRPGVEGLFQTRVHGRLERIDSNESSGSTVFEYESMTFGEDLPLQSADGAPADIQLQARIASSHETSRSVMTYDTAMGLPVDIESVSTQNETRIAAITVNGKEVSGGKPHQTQVQTFTRTKFIYGGRDAAFLRSMLDADEYFQLEGVDEP